MNEKLNREDLEILGEMGNMLGAHMQEFASGADPEARRRLFKSNLNIRETLANALRREDDSAQEAIKDVSHIPLNDVEKQILNKTQQRPPVIVPQEVQSAPENRTPIPPPKLNTSPQMEFDFAKQMVNGYGSVGDVIRHFNDRLDKMENSIYIIKNCLIEIKDNLPKRRNKSHAVIL